MSTRPSIFLSFFELNNQDFQFTVYRRPYEPGDTKDDNPVLMRYNLPPDGSFTHRDQVYESYWVGFEEGRKLEPFLCGVNTNNDLTCEYLYRLLQNACASRLQRDQYHLPDKNKIRKRRIAFVLESHSLGNREVWIEPFFLKSKQLFGILLDFTFRSADSSHSIETQKLSLSLDTSGRSNRSFYADRYRQVRKFIDIFSQHIFCLDDDISIIARRCLFDDELLRSKRYEFANGRTDTSQFLGVKKHGPVKQVGKRSHVHFIFVEDNRPLSNKLYFALNGKSFPSQFPGMQSMFGCQFDKDTVAGTPIEEFTVENVVGALNRKQSRQRPSSACFCFSV